MVGAGDGIASKNMLIPARREWGGVESSVVHRWKLPKRRRGATEPCHQNQNQSGFNWQYVHAFSLSGLYVTLQLEDVFEEQGSILYFSSKLSKLVFGLPGQHKPSFFFNQVCQLCVT